MRIGQILIEADLISPKQLSNGLEYGKAKHIALGRVLKLLKVMQDADIERALEAQKLIRLGLSPVIAVESLKRAVKQNVSLQNAIQERYKDALSSIGGAESPSKSSNFVEVDYAAEPEKLIDKGDRLLLEDQCEQAESHYLAARAVMERILGRNHIDLANVLVRLGNTYLATDRFDEAEECYEEVLILRMKAYPSYDPLIAQSYESLADLYKAKGDEEQARENYLLTLDILEHGLPANLSVYAAILRRIAASAQLVAAKETRPQPIGELLKAAGLLSEQQLADCLEQSKLTRMPVGTVLREQNLVKELDLQSCLKAQFYVRQGLLSEELAVDLLRRSARRNISLERLLHEAGILGQEQDKFEAYRELAVQLDQMVAAETVSGPLHDDIAPIAYSVAALYEQTGDRPQAEVYYARALKIWSKENRADLNAARASSALAQIYISQGRKLEAIPLLHKAFEQRQQALGTNHDETLESLEIISEIEIDQQNAAGAFPFLKAVLATREEMGQEESKLLRPVLLLGDCYRLMGDFQLAEENYQRAVALAQAGFGSASLALVAGVEKLGDLYAQMRENKKAQIQYDYGVRILKRAEKLDSEIGNRLQMKSSNSQALIAK